MEGLLVPDVQHSDSFVTDAWLFNWSGVRVLAQRVVNNDTQMLAIFIPFVFHLPVSE